MRKYDYCGACTFYLGAIVITLLCQALAGFVSAALTKSYPDIANSGDFNTAFMIVIQLANLAFIVLYSKINGYKPNFTVYRHEVTGKTVTPSVIILPVIAAWLLLVGMYLPTVWYGFFTRYALHIPPDFGTVSLTTASSVVMIVIASVFLAPVFEETIYRGVLFNGLTRERSTVKAALLSALAFMLMHINPVQVVFQFSLGVLSAFVMHKSKRLLPSVILHATANALALVMELTPLNGKLAGCVLWLTNNAAAAVFITLGLFVACFAALYALVRFGFDLPKLFGKNDCEQSDGEQEESGAKDTLDYKHDKNSVVTVRDEAMSEARRKDGTFRYWLAISICAVLFIINLVVGIT